MTRSLRKPKCKHHRNNAGKVTPVAPINETDMVLLPEGLQALELFRNKRPGKLSSKKTMEGANPWVYKSETTVR
jgi:hypothetical protein